MDGQNRNGGRQFDKKPAGGRANGRSFGDRKPFDRKSADGRPSDRKPFDRKSVDGKPSDRKPFDRKSADGKPFAKKPYGKRDGARMFGDQKPCDRKSAPRRPADHKTAPRRSMGPGARDVALKALRNVVRENAYASQALDRELTNVHLSDEDRRLAAGLFYTALENRLRIDRVIARFTAARPDPEIIDILHIAVAQILFMDRVPDHAAVDEAVEQARRAHRDGMTALVNGVLRNIIRAREADELALPDREADVQAYISEKYSVSPELVARLVAAYGAEETEAIAAWTPDRRSQAIRANHMRMSDADFETWLTNNKIEFEKSIVSDAYIAKNAGRLAAHEGYRSGMFSIQGESSMLAAAAVGARGGMQILDACAAPGGKTCYIAEAMRGSGRVYAWDLHDHRVDLIRAAAKRLELDNIRPQARDAQKFNENLEMQMDAVLVDAPCSGLGVMGDKPDIKYRLTGDTIDALIPIQASILETCARYVRVGGRLVYSTCTLLPEENERQVRAFLDAHPEFEPDNDAAYLPEALRAHVRDGMIQILPSRDHLEGFFIARLRRRDGGV